MVLLGLTGRKQASIGNWRHKEAPWVLLLFAIRPVAIIGKYKYCSMRYLCVRLRVCALSYLHSCGKKDTSEQRGSVAH